MNKPKGINRQGMYGVFDNRGNLIPYSIDYSAKQAIRNVYEITRWNWEFLKQDGYFTNRIDVFIVPVSTVKTFKK